MRMSKIIVHALHLHTPTAKQVRGLRCQLFSSGRIANYRHSLENIFSVLDFKQYFSHEFHSN